ncbi:MAG: LysR family transcriptional regulator [Lachnospiraceae bacterium]|nr:LysR family transcriptional regulator [Lachnospiraceae bacterium]
MREKKNEYFLKVCETGNITTAADELFISRSVLSRALHELEEEFDATLFTRSKQGVELTESGKVIRDMIQSIEANYRYARDKLSDVKKQTASDNIKIGITPTNGLVFYKKYYSAFTNEFPDIQLTMEEHSAFDISTLLMDRSLDVGITPVVYGDDYFDNMVLFSDKLVLGMRKNDPLAKKNVISLSDMTDLPLGFLSARVPMEGIVKEYISAQRKTANIVVRTTDKELLHQMAADGICYPLLTKDMMSAWKDISYRQLGFITPSVIRLIWPRMSVIRPGLETFINFMKRCDGSA